MLKVFNIYQLMMETIEVKYREQRKDFKHKEREKLQRVMSAYESDRIELDEEIKELKKKLEASERREQVNELQRIKEKKKYRELKKMIFKHKNSIEESKQENLKLVRDNKVLKT